MRMILNPICAAAGRRKPSGSLGWVPALVCALTLVLASCDQPTGTGAYMPPERISSGGATTVTNVTSHAFSQPSPTLVGSRLDLHLAGDVAFEDQFVRAPAPVNPGLGPLFNKSSCEGCHIADGRTREGFLMRLSVPGQDSNGGPLPVEGFGGQLQNDAVFGVSPEGRIATEWIPSTVTLPGGESVTLRRRIHTIEAPYAPLPAGVLTSVRMPRPVFGLGLLEAISESTLESLADPNDSDDDGISGRVNRVFDHSDDRMRIGRFGWKASQPSVLQQVAAAYLNDMGVTSSVFPEESSSTQPQHDALDDDPELPDDILAAAVFYVQTLGVPAPRAFDDPTVVRGEDLFDEIGCASCHLSRLETGPSSSVPEVANQVIFPFTDLLLHDMGPDLADGRPDWDASGSEWRTPPLWGLGLSHQVTGHSDFLHDGRARTVVEAILWHGGEAQAARDGFAALSSEDRGALITFLESL